MPWQLRGRAESDYCQLAEGEYWNYYWAISSSIVQVSLPVSNGASSERDCQRYHIVT